MAVTVCLINMKGGVGKTTLTTQLAHACFRKGMRVLAVDLDPQANLSQALLTPETYKTRLQNQKATVVQVFTGHMPPTEASPSPEKVKLDHIIHKLRKEKLSSFRHSCLDVILSRLELSQVLKNSKRFSSRLAASLSEIANRYDLILIDCAPTESQLTEAAYHASRYILVPVKPEFLATIGLPLLKSSVKAFKSQNGDHALDLCGIVFNHSSDYSAGPEIKTSIQEVEAIAEENHWHIFDTRIRYSRSYAKASREAVAIGRTSYVRHEVASEFNSFVSEFLKRIGLAKWSKV